MGSVSGINMKHGFIRALFAIVIKVAGTRVNVGNVGAREILERSRC